MKTLSIFVLLIYWSIIILAPVLSKEINEKKNQKIISPMINPNK
jgi:hypothetical protein